MQLSDERVLGIRKISEPTSLKVVRSFLGMVNYFRDSINGLWGHMIPFNNASKEKIKLGNIYFTKCAKISFEKVKDILVERTKLTIMNE